MSLSISVSSSPAEQRQQAYNHIHNNLQRFTFKDTNYAFVPLTIMQDMATYANIHAVCTNDVRLSKEYFPSHSRDFFANRMRKDAPRCFAAVMYAKESMYFLRQLTNFAADEQLPTNTDSAKIEPELQSALSKFGELQPVFFAPVLKVGNYAQAVITLPCVEVEETGKEEKGKVVYRVEFCEGHVEGGKGREYFMVGFGERKKAEEDVLWQRSKLGFRWGEEYFLCFE